jgi:hypothetical protein
MIRLTNGVAFPLHARSIRSKRDRESLAAKRHRSVARFIQTVVRFRVRYVSLATCVGDRAARIDIRAYTGQSQTRHDTSARLHGPIAPIAPPRLQSPRAISQRVTFRLEIRTRGTDACTIRQRPCTNSHSRARLGTALPHASPTDTHDYHLPSHHQQSLIDAEIQPPRARASPGHERAGRLNTQPSNAHARSILRTHP